MSLSDRRDVRTRETKLLLTDALQLTAKPVIDAAGNMLVSARSARSGTQLYTGAEVGKPELPWVTVYRDPADVFDAESLESYTAIPVTINHPRDMVTVDNWKDVAVGETDGAIKDGDFIRVPFTVRHKRAIKSITDGHAEISMGYTCDLLWDAGTTATGEAYDAKVTNLRMNHLAVVSKARGGDKLRIGDGVDNPAKERNNMATFMLDGLKVDLSDEEAVSAALTKLRDAKATAEGERDTAAKALTDAEVAHAAALKDANAAKDKAEADVVSLTKSLEDAKTTPEQLRDAAKAYATLVDSATKIAPAFKVEDSMTDADIRKGVVLTVFGDSYKDKSETFFDALFEVEAAKIADGKSEDRTDTFRETLASRNVTDFADAAAKAKTAREKMIAGFTAPREAAK